VQESARIRGKKSFAKSRCKNTARFDPRGNIIGKEMWENKIGKITCLLPRHSNPREEMSTIQVFMINIDTIETHIN
jgi:hypothetical protein